MLSEGRQAITLLDCFAESEAKNCLRHRDIAGMHVRTSFEASLLIRTTISSGATRL